MELPKPIEYEKAPETQVEKDFFVIAQTVNGILRYLKKRDGKNFSITDTYVSQEPPKEKECDHCFCEAGDRCCLCGKLDTKPELDVEETWKSIASTLYFTNWGSEEELLIYLKERFANLR